MILVDTSVWVTHLRKRLTRLVDALEVNEVMTHPFVRGELALGGSGHKSNLIALLQFLPAARVIEHADVLAAVGRLALVGKGIGWVDAHLLAASLVEGASLWTLDAKLRRAAHEAGCAVEL
ncbi:MAG: type II toxin-antitoxin system VapC family toxin [Clostridia bacterium]|nr:type II toxin-antitoxin system VapC family toxin [Deltaproteobacteria bacterium]